MLNKEASRYVYDSHVLTAVKMNYIYCKSKWFNLSNFYCAYPFQRSHAVRQCSVILYYHDEVILSSSTPCFTKCWSKFYPTNFLISDWLYFKKNHILHILVQSHMFCIYSETMQCSNDYHTVTLFREVWILNWKMQSWVTLTSGSKWILDLYWIWHNYWTVQKNALPFVNHRLVWYCVWGCENCTEQGDGCELLFRVIKLMLHYHTIQDLLPFVSA